VIHAWAPWVWGTTKSALYKYTYLPTYLPTKEDGYPLTGPSVE